MRKVVSLLVPILLIGHVSSSSALAATPSPCAGGVVALTFDDGPWPETDAMLERKRGSLIFTSTFVGHTAGMPGVAAYAASKAGLIGLTQALAVEFGPKGIRVNALLPGGTETDMAKPMIGTPEQRAFVVNMHALKRIAAPEEIAQSALYLASDASSFTTGSAMLVDGGVSINRT